MLFLGVPHVLDDLAVLVDCRVPAIDDRRVISAPLRGRELQGDLVSPPDVVGVERREVAAPCAAQARVPGSGHAVVPLAHEMHARIRASMPFGDRAGIVGGPVIDDDDLEVGVGLRPRAAQGLVDG